MRFQIKLLTIPTCVLLFAVPVFGDYRAEDYGADPSIPSNSLAIQTALDQAGSAGGGVVTVTRPGVYLLQTQGPNPYATGHRYCINIRYDNTTLVIGQGVTLKLANGQQTTEPVDIIVFRGRKNLVFDGRGTITGNTAGQPWAQGYSQISNGIIISGYGTAAGANQNITISNITLADHFSNPINIDSAGGVTRNSGIRINNVTSRDCGEGIEVIRADDVWIENCLVDSPSHVAVGDAIEISDVTRFHLKGNTARNHWNASGFDIYGCRHGTVESFVADSCAAGITIHGTGVDVPYPEDVLVNGGIIINPRDRTGTGAVSGVELVGASLANITVSNVKIKGTQYTFGFQGPSDGVTSKATGPVTIENCEVSGAQDGILLGPISNLTIRGGNYSNNSNRGICLFYISGLTSADIKNLHVQGVTATGNVGLGISIFNQGFIVPPISGAIRNCLLEDNGGGAIDAGPEGRELVVETITPSTRSGGDNTSIFGVTQFCPTGDITTFRNPSKNQVVMIIGCGEQNIFDARQNGNNIYLNGAVAAHLRVGVVLTLRYDSLTEKWWEVSRNFGTYKISR